MALPVARLVLPSALLGQRNGMIPASARSIAEGGGSTLQHTAARAWSAMKKAALRSGWVLSYTGCYRSYSQQVTLFKARYDIDPTPYGSKVWNGVRYYKKKGVAMAAVPGTSNHGWGLAIDMALPGPSGLRSIAPAMPWLLAHAHLYGFSWEAQSEIWHVRYVTGDDIPLAVLREEGGTHVPLPEPPPKPPVEPPDEQALPEVHLASIYY